MGRKNWERIVVPVAVRLALESGSGGSGVASGARVTAVDIDTDANTYVITYSDGSAVHGAGVFDDNGLCTSLTDDAGSSVEFVLGAPTAAVDSQGNRVSITVGGS